MGVELLRASTRQALRECILLATDRQGYDLEAQMRAHGLLDAGIKLAGPETAKTAFDMVFQDIDWRDRDSILPIIPLFEHCYVLSPRNFSSLHHYLDSVLAYDGFRMKDGRLVRLPL